MGALVRQNLETLREVIAQHNPSSLGASKPA
jgi:hypothetical protein